MLAILFIVGTELVIDGGMSCACGSSGGQRPIKLTSA